MGAISDTYPLFIEILCGFFLLFWWFYHSLTKKYGYWKDKGVPYLEPVFPFGCTKDLFLGRKQFGEIYDTFYKKFKGKPYFGVYEMQKPVLVVRDPQLIKHILTKDFSHFMDRFTLNINPKIDYLALHLFNIGGQEWKRMRVKLSPTFSSGKMKMMFLLMDKCGEQLTDYLTNQTKVDPVVDVKDVLARFTMDIIATSAFGLETNSLINKNCEFYHQGLRILDTNLYRLFRRILFAIFPSLSKAMGVRLIPKETTDFFTRIIRETVEYREKNNIERNDFLNLLIQVRQNKNLSEQDQSNGDISVGEDKLKCSTEFTIEEIAAQAFVFFLAGFETASSTMTFCLYELAQNPEVQEKLYQEVTEILQKHGDKPTYQALQEMPYMEKVINETLRRYASLSILNRVCTEAYKIPGSELVLEKGQAVVIPTYAIHHDPQYYVDPYKFDPERFTPERVRERHPYVHLPFGEGPRMCIGMRFGLLQTKIGLTQMIKNFEFKLTPETTVPVSLNKRAFVTQPDKPILLHLSQRNTGHI